MRRPPRYIVVRLAVAVLAVLGFGASRQRTLAQEGGDLDVVQLRPNFYVIGGAGGNIVLQTGPVGVILVDSGSTAMSDKVLTTIRRITPLPIRYIINTSMAADHVGGNETIAKAGLSILAGAIAAGAGLSDELGTKSGRARGVGARDVLRRHA